MKSATKRAPDISLFCAPFSSPIATTTTSAAAQNIPLFSVRVQRLLPPDCLERSEAFSPLLSFPLSSLLLLPKWLQLRSTPLFSPPPSPPVLPLLPGSMPSSSRLGLVGCCSCYVYTEQHADSSGKGAHTVP